MRITQIDLWHVSIPLKGAFYPAWIPGFPQTENRFTLIRLRTHSGLEGWSAGAALSREREGLGSLLGPYLLGERADDIASIRQRIREMGYLGQRMSWIEPACWDIIGKAQRKPVYQLLGGQDEGPINLYASTGQVHDLATSTRLIETYGAEGFNAVKLRVHAATLEEDVARIRNVRSAVGDKFILGVDANQGWRVAVVADAPTWDYARALTFSRAAEEYGYKWVEEPLAMDNYAGLARLRANTHIDIAGGELNNQGLPEFGVLLEKQCFDIYQPDACFTGGIAETWQIAQKVEAAGFRYTPHTWTNGIGFAINLQLLAALPRHGEILLEYPYDPPWVPEARDGVLEEPFKHQGGKLTIPNAPGLGITIDHRQLRRYGKHFFRATSLRVAVATVLDKGIRTAKEIGSIRDARLKARSDTLDDRATRGEAPWQEALTTSSSTPSIATVA